MIAEVDLPFLKQVKNSILFSVKLAPIGLPLFLVCLVPIALFFVKSSFFSIIWLVVMMMFGTTLYGLTFTAFSQWALDNVLTPLYMMTQQNRRRRKIKGKTKRGHGTRNGGNRKTRRKRKRHSRGKPERKKGKRRKK